MDHNVFRWILNLFKYWRSGSNSNHNRLLIYNWLWLLSVLTTGRQTHKTFFEKSNLFFLCMLKPLSFEISAQESEIEAAQVTYFPFQWLSSLYHLNTQENSFSWKCLQWMPWEEYTKQPFVQNHELLRYMTEICSAKTNGDYEGFTSIPVSEHDQQGNLYFNSLDLLPRH